MNCHNHIVVLVILGYLFESKIVVLCNFFAMLAPGRDSMTLAAYIDSVFAPIRDWVG